MTSHFDLKNSSRHQQCNPVIYLHSKVLFLIHAFLDLTSTSTLIWSSRDVIRSQPPVALVKNEWKNCYLAALEARTEKDNLAKRDENSGLSGSFGVTTGWWSCRTSHLDHARLLSVIVSRSCNQIQSVKMSPFCFILNWPWKKERTKKKKN